MTIPERLFYTKEHEWVDIDGNLATIGITEYAQHLLGDITFVELPKVKEKIEQFKHFATVESVKAASDVYAPLSGEVTKINTSLQDTPQLINQSPYEKAWFVVIKIDPSLKEKEALLSSDAYKRYLETLSR